MSGFQIKRGTMGEPPREVIKLVFDEDPAVDNLPHHRLLNCVETDRIYFQFPQVAPNNSYFSENPIPWIIKYAPGVFAVESVRAVDILRRQGGALTLEQPEYFRNPSFVARLSSGEGKHHPLDYWLLINHIIDAAYQPDTLLTQSFTDPKVGLLRQPRRMIVF